MRLCNRRAHPDLNQGPADLQSAALATELCTHVYFFAELLITRCILHPPAPAILGHPDIVSEFDLVARQNEIFFADQAMSALLLFKRVLRRSNRICQLVHEN